MLKKSLAMLLTLTMLFSVLTVHAEETLQTSFVYEVEARPVLNDILQSGEYEILSFRAANVVFDSAANKVWFQNDQKRENGIADTNTYIIDNNTALSQYANGEYGVNVDEFIAGNAPWIDLVLKKEVKQQILDGMNDNEIHVDGVWGISSKDGLVEAKDKQTEEQTTDNAGRQCISKVLKYKIMQGDENGNLKLESPVTRAEMAQLVANALYLGGVEASFAEGEEFSDVPDTHWAYDAIAHAKAHGIVNGMGDGTFAPDDNITVAQAVKMVVATLGYTPLAEQRAAYPHGFMIVANTLGVTQGLTLSNNEPALRGDIAMMFENAMDIPMMGQIGFGSEPEFAIFDGQNGNALITIETELAEVYLNEDE